jgi:aconitate hydratase
VAVACALTGKITDPTTLGEMPEVTMPESFRVDDRGVLLPAPADEADEVQIERGPNIGKCPVGSALENEIAAEVVLKVEDDITTDHIMPAGAKILPYRSNIPFLSKFCFSAVDPDFAERAKATENGVIVGGFNYGQGSSREHAALVPLYLGVRAVITKSFSRIHRANLINAGILPLTFKDPEEYDKLSLGGRLTLSDLHEGLEKGTLTLKTEDGKEIELVAEFSERQRRILLAGGLLPYTRDN